MKAFFLLLTVMLAFTQAHSMNATKILRKPIVIATPADGDTLIYNESIAKWEFGAGSGGDASTIGFTPVSNIAATDTQAAIAEVNAERATLTLSNLAGTVAIPDNVHILPANSAGITIGSTSKHISSLVTRQVSIYNSSAAEQYGVNGAIVIPDGSTTSGIRVESSTIPFTIMSRNQSSSTASVGVNIQTGNTVDGASANIAVRTGVPTGSGARGKFVVEAASMQIPVAAATPAAGNDGEIMYNTTDDKLYVRANGTWVATH